MSPGLHLLLVISRLAAPEIAGLSIAQAALVLPRQQRTMRLYGTAFTYVRGGQHVTRPLTVFSLPLQFSARRPLAGLVKRAVAPPSRTMVAAHGKETSKDQEAQHEKREAENGHDEPDAKKQRKEYSEQSAGKDKKKEKSEEKDEEQQAQHEEQAGEQEGEQGGNDTESEYDPDEDHDDERDVPKVFDERKPEPKRAEDGTLIFDDYPDFVPNLTPKEVLQKGGFGGTYFREIKSAVIGEVISADDWKEYPQDWFKGLDPEKHLTRPWGEYDKSINNYGVKCGRELEFWEEKGWISPIDPRGWFQWYCRFYCGRRSEDDQRQVGRALRLMGPKGRFRNQLINRIAREGKTYDDRSVSPVMRQVLQHWGYELTEKDFKEYARSKGHDV